MKDFKIYLTAASFFMAIYLIAEYNKPTPTNWTPTLYFNDKVPYGTFLVYHQLNTLFPGAKVINTNSTIYSNFHDSSSMNGNYLIIAKSVNMNNFDFNELIKYVKAGNSVFISCFNFKGFLADTLSLSTAYENSKRNAELNFTNNQLKSSKNYIFRRDISNQYFNEFDTSKAIVICKNNFGHSTCLDFKFGKGNLLVCANPCVFSNYSLLTAGGADYAAKVLAYMPVTKNIYWDEFQNGDIPADESPLRVFFNHPSLQWAYYLSLFGILTFVLFEIKRRQRVIPVIEPLANSTLEFVNVVGQVYYEKRNNANIAHKKILYLMEYLREQYQLKTNKLDNEFIEKLKAKSGIETSLATELVNYIQYITVQDKVTDRELIELNKLIEKLYIQSR